MGNFKALLLASAFALATAGAATAADLLPPPPLPEPPVADPIFDGWYLRADIGIGLNNVKLRQSYNDARSIAGGGGVFNPRAAENDIRVDQKGLDDSTFLRLGVGYQVNPWFRADITGEYRTAAAFHAVESFANTSFQAAPSNAGDCNGNTAPRRFVSPGVVTPTGAVNPIDRCYDQYRASVRSALLMANGYVDLGTWYNITPYVGAGVGFARNSITNLTDTGAGTSFGIARNSSKYNAAYALMAGLAYSVTPNLKLELGYRYLDLGSINSKDIVCNDQTPGSCHFEVQKLKLSSNDVHIGMRWMLSANTYGNGQALYWGQGGAAAGSLTGGAGYATGGRYAAGGGGYADPGGRPLVKRY